MGQGRPKIPAQTERELWARAAGRCEFRGCNKLLYKDGLTQQRSNLAVISHIVAYSLAGPRGDLIRSTLLQTDIRNLMLTCRDHGKIIDDKGREDEYPEPLLLEFKREHEQRVRMLTESTEDAQTHVLLLQACVDGRASEIDERAAFRAILPRYPAEEGAMVIDLSGVVLPTDSDGVFPMMAMAITTRAQDVLFRRTGQRQVKRLSVFALAPIPLLVHFGHLLGDIEHVDLYQRHRDRQDWIWKEDEEAGDFFDVSGPDGPDDLAEIAVALSVSVQINRDEVTAALGRPPRVYEIRAAHPGLDFLNSRRRLEIFGYEARKLLTHLREVYGQDRTVHIFAAVPAPVAIEFGRAIKDFHPTFRIYEYRKADRTFFPALTINQLLYEVRP